MTEKQEQFRKELLSMKDNKSIIKLFKRILKFYEEILFETTIDSSERDLIILTEVVEIIVCWDVEKRFLAGYYGNKTIFINMDQVISFYGTVLRK